MRLWKTIILPLISSVPRGGEGMFRQQEEMHKGICIYRCQLAKCDGKGFFYEY